MKHILQIILAFIVLQSSLFASTVKADDWKIYASYHNATKAVQTDSRIFVLANGDLFSYDTEDESVETYDKTNYLTDFRIADIAYCKVAKTLFIIYSNANIDLLNMDGETWNMPELKNKSLDDKTINEVVVVGDEAFISTGSGLAVVNMTRKYFSNFYTFGGKVTNCAVVDGKLYVKTNKGIYQGDRSKNLLDTGNWTLLSAAPQGVTLGPSAEQVAETAELLAKVADINIDSPIRNYFYRIKMAGERLLVAGGNWYYPESDCEGTVMKFEDGKWTSFDEEGPIALVGKRVYNNITDIVQDPEDSEHHWVSSKKSGIYEFRDYKMVNHYSYDNSPLVTLLPGDYYQSWYVRTTALNIDKEGNLWMCNNQADTVVCILKKDGTWKKYYYPEIENYPTFDSHLFDKRGWAWLQQRRTTSNGWLAGVMVINTNGTIDTQADDQARFISTFVNQDATSYTPNLYYCVEEDVNGYIWIGTSDGLFVSYDPTKVFDKDFFLSQVKVPRNDGTNYADYLLNGVPVKCIAFDGGNRKWIGTLNNGVYLISADGLETIAHYTTENSPLISNEVNSIAINGKTGEVFIATSLGLCSVKGESTDPEVTMSSDKLKVWPNPVRPEYSGNVHIGGLMANSVVKIVNAAGKLVYEGESVGGMFSWNCTYKTGKHVAAGIYYALCCDEDGNENACAKIVVIK